MDPAVPDTSRVVGKPRPSKRAQILADVMGLTAAAGGVLAITANGWEIWLGMALVLAGAATALIVYRPRRGRSR